MKIRVKRRTKEKQDAPARNILDRRIKLPRNMRFGAIGILFLFFVFSVYNLQAIDEEPKITIKSNVISSYSQNGNFDYTIYLKDNTVYDGRKTIKPEDNLVAFRNIVDHITGSFSYFFYSSKPATITGEYKLTALLQTDIWSKQYSLTSGRFTNNFDEEFPIDYRFYENVTATIDAETGVSATNPQLTIKCEIYNLKIKTDTNTFDPGKFSPSLTFSLNQKTISFPAELKNQIEGAQTSKEEIITQADNKDKELWTSNSYLFIIIIIIFSLVTRGDTGKLSEIEKQVKKINKKYAEWIVEVDIPPKRPLGTELVTIKSLEDLMKIGEELGKPVIYHVSELEGTYTYYVLDETMHYKYVIYDKEKFIENLVQDKEKFNTNV